jgi:hypothetical protein
MRNKPILFSRAEVNVILLTQRKEWAIALDLCCVCLNCAALCAEVLCDVNSCGDEFVWARHGGAPLVPLLKLFGRRLFWFTPPRLNAA